MKTQIKKRRDDAGAERVSVREGCVNWDSFNFSVMLKGNMNASEI